MQKLNKVSKLMISPTKNSSHPQNIPSKVFHCALFQVFQRLSDPPVIHCQWLQVELLVICRLPKRSMVRSEPEVPPAVQVEGSIRQGIHPNVR